jgi:hypothetical protein
MNGEWYETSLIPLPCLQVVGTLGILFMPVPLLMKQCYVVWVGVLMAYIFTWIPDWTGWVLLIAMAIYDIAAVLAPGGPLKVRQGLFALHVRHFFCYKDSSNGTLLLP